MKRAYTHTKSFLLLMYVEFCRCQKRYHVFSFAFFVYDRVCETPNPPAIVMQFNIFCVSCETSRLKKKRPLSKLLSCWYMVPVNVRRHVLAVAAVPVDVVTDSAVDFNDR